MQLPGVTSGGNGPGTSTIYIRGLASTTPNLTVAGVAGLAPNVSFYLDEQPLGQPGRNLDVYAADVARIEVLSGPQGTLFGSSSQAGVVRLITNKPKAEIWKNALFEVIPPIFLILAVLGSIFLGVATPTESASVGAAGAAILALLRRDLNLKNISEAAITTVKMSSFVFIILIGASMFSLVFRGFQGDEMISNFLNEVKPDTVFLPFPDRHIDHKNIFEASLVASS